jgi:hypothetical protein
MHAQQTSAKPNNASGAVAVLDFSSPPLADPEFEATRP